MNANVIEFSVLKGSLPSCALYENSSQIRGSTHTKLIYGLAEGGDSAILIMTFPIYLSI